MGQIFGDASKSSLQMIIDKIAKFKVTHSVLKKNFHVFFRVLAHFWDFLRAPSHPNSLETPPNRF